MLHHVVIVAKDFLRHDVAMSTKPTRASTAHIVPFGLRLQPELKARLEESAKKEGRSLNAEIAARLESSFYSEEGMPMLIQSIGSLVRTVETYKSAADSQKEEIAQMREELRKFASASKHKK
jgi:hypothetical protein